MPDLVDYLEGFIVPNQPSLLGTSIAFPAHLGFMPEFHKVYYCIEFAVHDFQTGGANAEQVVEKITKQMSHMPSLVHSVEVSYFDFLNRVRIEEMSLRSRGLWEVPHPWLNMFVPKSGIKHFKDLLLDNIPPEEFEGPILVYPLLRDKWDANTSAVLPDAPVEQVVYIVGVLRSATPASCSARCLGDILRRNRRIAEAASAPRIGGKQYLPRHPSPLHWRDHFGLRWNRFAARKSLFDPLGLLAPGQGIFAGTHDSTV
ncbi:hypothetical protein GW17_00048625 [Ensete ventricosum]|nr:hypothetical protein GW17_00048625 [Ensete ventricosum]